MFFNGAIDKTKPCIDKCYYCYSLVLENYVNMHRSSIALTVRAEY